MRHNPAVDMHAHFLPATLPGADPDAAAQWPRMVHRGADVADLFIGDRHFRTVDSRCWDLERRIGDMDRDHVGHQLLSPIPVSLSYNLPYAGAATIARALNEWVAEAVRTFPERFSGLGTVPLQDPEAAAELLVDQVQSLGLVGVEIGTHVAGRSLDDPALDVFWAAAEQVQAVLFIHPIAPLGGDRLRAYGMQTCLGMPFETAQAAVSLILGGVLDRHPGLTLLLAHGGGALPWILPRVDRCWHEGLTGETSSRRPPSAYASAFYYDTLVYEPTHLAMLTRLVGEQRLVLGTDYPFAISEQPPGSAIRRAELSADVTELLAAANARKLLAREETRA